MSTRALMPQISYEYNVVSRVDHELSAKYLNHFGDERWCLVSMDDTQLCFLRVVAKEISLADEPDEPEEKPFTFTTAEQWTAKATPIIDVDPALSVRAYNALSNGKIRVVGQLTEHRENEVLRIKGIGRETLKEIASLLQSMGLHFKED